MRQSSIPVRLRLAVLDMVGTTVQTGHEVPRAFRGAFRELGVHLSDESIAEVRGRSKAEAISTLIQRLLPTAEDPEAMTRAVHSRFVTLLRESYAAEPVPVPGAASVMGWLRDAGVRVALTTGLDRRTADQLVKGLGWDSAGLDAVVCGDDVRRGRPAPDLIHTAMRLAGESDPRAVLAVGDTTSDLEAAAAAGVGWSVGVTGGAHTRERLQLQPHSAILASIADLPGWLRESGVLEY